MEVAGEALGHAHLPAVLRPVSPRCRYASMLAEKMEKHGSTAWLVNTGWTGGRLVSALLAF